MASIELMALTFNKETLSDKKVYAFQISETFKKILERIHTEAGTNYSGRKIFYIANALQQTEVVHCHGDLKTINENNDVWFYSDNEFNPKLLFTFIFGWMRDEISKYGLNFELSPNSEFYGKFIELSWSDLLDKDTYSNGKKALEKLCLSLLEDKYFEFLTGNAGALMLHRVINNSDSMLMSQPCFPEKNTAYSYTLKAKVEQLDNNDEYKISFFPSVRLWIQESPLAYSNYFKHKETTNAYLTSPGLLSDVKKVIFNQISLSKDKTGIYSNKIAHESFLKVSNIKLQELLEKELTTFDVKSTNLLVTLPNDCRTRNQKVSKKQRTTTAYGLGLPEREKIFFFVKKELMEHGFKEILPLIPIKGSLSFNKTIKFDKINTFIKYGIEDFLDYDALYEDLEKRTKTWEDKCKKIDEKNKLNNENKKYPDKPELAKIDLNKEPFISFNEKKEIKIAIFSAEPLMQRVLIATTRMIMHAEEQVSETIYKNKGGVTIEFIVFEDNISNELSKTSEVNERIRQIDSLVRGKSIDGAFVEVGDLKGSNKDPKARLRTIFASFGIKTQFIHPLKEETAKRTLAKVKDDVYNRSLACSHDLMSKLGFVDIKTKDYFDKNASYTAVSRIRFFNQSLIPVIIQNTHDGAKMKIYPETEWIKFDELDEKINKRYIQQKEVDWKKLSYNERCNFQLEWLKSELNEIHNSDKETKVIWDIRLDSMLSISDINFDEFINQKLQLPELTIIRYEYANTNMGYLARSVRKGKEELGRVKGIFQPEFYKNKWILIGARVRNSANTKNTKWENPSNSLIAPSLCEASVHTTKDINHFEEVRDLQYLRMANITFDVESSYPYPMSLTRYIEELISAFYDCHSKEALEDRKEKNKVEKEIQQLNLFNIQ